MASFGPANKLQGLLILMILIPYAASLTTVNNVIIDGSGKPVIFKGVNWFGFDDGETAVDGLYAGGDAIQSDFATIVYRMRLVGFNAVRLPFSFKDLYNLTPKTDFYRNCFLNTNADVASSVIPPGVSAPPGSAAPGPLNSVPGRTPGTTSACNSYLPSSTVVDRFVWVANYFATAGFYVIADNHLQDPTVTESITNWNNLWADLVTRLSADPTTARQLIVDPLNEPDGHSLNWSSLKDIYINLMDRLIAINSNILFFIEGAGQQNEGANWGDGFVTNLQLIQQRGLSDPNPFFQTLLGRSYKNQVVLAPHIYGPTVTGATTNYSGDGLYWRLTTSFGYLTTTGYSYNGQTKRFPVVLGEIGSNLGDSRDLAYLNSVSVYLNGGGDSGHAALSGWFWWAWNANAGGTGGLVMNNWRDLRWDKLQYLDNQLGLTPWYAGQTVTTSPPSPSPSVSPPPQLQPPLPAASPSPTPPTNTPSPKSSPPPISPPPQSPPPTFSPSPVSPPPRSSPPSPVQSPPPPAATPPPSPTSTSSCAARYTVSSVWGSPSSYFGSVSIYLKDLGTSPIVAPYKMVIQNPAYTGVSSAWNFAGTTTSNGAITTTVPYSWQTLPTIGAEVGVGGYICMSTSNNVAPVAVIVNGVTCTLMGSTSR